MRDPDRIDLVLDAIREEWVKHPDLRLGQIIYNTMMFELGCRIMEPNETLSYLREMEDHHLADAVCNHLNHLH